MYLLKGNIRKLYFKYLSAAFGSALITSVYALVDMAMVGQYHGPVGTAALAVIQPVWNVIYSLGLLMGIGGSVLFSMVRGKAEEENGRENEYFTADIPCGCRMGGHTAFGTSDTVVFRGRRKLSAFGGTLSFAHKDCIPPVSVQSGHFRFPAERQPP